MFILKNLILLVIFLNLLGCKSSEPNQSNESKTELNSPASTTELNSPDTKSADNDLFLVSISVPEKVGINEVFTIKADFKKETEKESTIMSGQQMFVYSIRDSTGKGINSYAVTDGGIERIIPGKAVISEEYKYRINKPGVYDVSAVAEFTANEGGSSIDYKIETVHKKIEVIDHTE